MPIRWHISRRPARSGDRHPVNDLVRATGLFKTELRLLLAANAKTYMFFSCKERHSISQWLFETAEFAGRMVRFDLYYFSLVVHHEGALLDEGFLNGHSGKECKVCAGTCNIRQINPMDGGPGACFDCDGFTCLQPYFRTGNIEFELT